MFVSNGYWEGESTGQPDEEKESSLIALILEAVKEWFLKAADLAVRVLKVKTAEVGTVITDGMNISDASGVPYCVVLANGQIALISGKCDE